MRWWDRGSRLATRRPPRLVLGGVVALLALLVAAVAVLYAARGSDGDAGGSAGSLDAGTARTLEAPAEAADGGAFAEEFAPAADPAQAPLPAGPIGREVVRSAQLTVEVGDVPGAARSVRTAATAVDGLVAAEQADRTGAWLVLRVPVAALDGLVDDIAGYGTVLSRAGQAEDVTEQVIDLDARVQSQQASVARVRALLAEATSIADVVAVESELARREAELDSLVGRLAYLRDQVALSTLTVDLRGEGTGADEPPPGFAGGLAAGWDGLRALGGATAAVIGFVLPFLPLVALVAGVVWLARRRARPGRAVVASSGPGSAGET